MSKDEQARGPWDSAWWTAERRATASAYRKAHPQGSRTKEWWTPERKAAHKARLKEVWAAMDDGG